MKTVPGDALITSACVMYNGPMDEAMRLQVLTNWLNRYISRIHTYDCVLLLWLRLRLHLESTISTIETLEIAMVVMYLVKF